MKTKYNNIFRLIAIIFLIGLFGLINSCKKSTPTEPQNSTSSPSSSTITEIGKISYSPDYSKEKTATLDTSAINISTTDANGIKWDLSIPKQGFVDSTNISIIPIKDVKSDSVLNIKNGVIFQPDGFQFSSTATLTVTVPNASNKYAFYSFSQDGQNVEFASFSGSGGVYKIPITHFSGAAAGVPSNPDQICKIATAKYNTELAEENKMVNQDPVVPVPPDIDIKCGIDASKEKEINDYVKKFMLPEDTVIKNMLGTLAAIQAYGCDASLSAAGMAQTSLLAVHLMTKAQMAYDQYSNDNKKFFAVAKAMLTASATLQILGGTPRADLLAELGNWAKNYYDAQANKLINDHDYSVINSLMLLATQASLLGVNNIYLGQMEEATTFKFSLNEDLKNLVDGSLSDHIVINGNVSFNLFNPGATAEIKYVSGYLIDGCQDSQGNPQPAHDEIVLPQSFPLNIILTRFDLCKSDTAIIKFGMLGAETEDWNFGIGGSGVVASTCARYVVPNHQFTRVDNMAVFNGTQYFNLTKQEFTFHIPIKNLNATAFDKTFVVAQSYGGGTYSANLELKLVHTPL